MPFWGETLDYAIFDIFFQIRGPLTEESDIVLVGIDDDSFQYLNLQWPWPRSLHAKLLASLSAARARVVVFDVLFDTHSRDPQDDHLFAVVIAAHPNVVLATARTITEKKTFTKESWLNPLAPLLSANTSTGCIELTVDTDGVVRKAQLSFAASLPSGIWPPKDLSVRNMEKQSRIKFQVGRNMASWQLST